MKGLLLVSVLAVVGCASSRTPHRETIVPIGAAATAAPLAERAPQTCPDDELARWVAVVAKTLAGGNPGSVQLKGPHVAVACTLSANGFSLRAKDADLTVNLATTPAGARDALRLWPSVKPLIVVWTDDSPGSNENAELHFVFPIGAKTGHIVLRAPGDDRHRASFMRMRFAERGLWARNIGREILATHEDGSADIRVVGYVSGEYLFVANRYALVISLHGGIAEEADGLHQKQSVAAQVFGPPRAQRHAKLETTTYYAIGTCSTEWVNALPMVIRGRLRATDGGLSLEDAHIDRPLPLATWTAMRPGHARAMMAATAAVKRNDLRAAGVAMQKFSAELRRAYGDASTLLELDVLLVRLQVAFEQGSLPTALAALEDVRCDMSPDERDLHSALDEARRRKTREESKDEAATPPIQ